MATDYNKIPLRKKGVTDEVLWITLNDEEMMNALSDTMQQELLLSSMISPSIIPSGVVLRGAGDKAFRAEATSSFLKV
jgi:enoyl-CoA hydratase/carnithine racemase